MSLFDDAKLIITPNGYKESKLFSLKPFDGTGDCTVVRNTTATRVNSAGLIESVASNVPRLDYSGGVTCPAVLVEPQRTNLLLRSEEFDNAYWSKTAGITVTPNTTISPDGFTSADTIASDGASGFRAVSRAVTVDTATIYNVSIFVKKGTNTSCALRIISGSSDGRIILNLTTLVLGSFGSVFNSYIEDMGSGWYKIGFSITSDDTSALVLIYPQSTGLAEAGNQIFWGAQLEQAATPTSYIPTVAATVTRNADVITATVPAGVTEITEYFENNTTNVITTIPVTYTMSVGRISKVVMI